MPFPRQFTMMAPGISLSGWAVRGEWETVGSSAWSGPGAEYHYQSKLDLRGLLAGDEQGVALSTVNLQEATPWMQSAVGFKGWMFTLDILTTVKPNDSALETWFNQPDLPGSMPGFLEPIHTRTDEEDVQDFNPSQIVWGMWRFWGVDLMSPLGNLPQLKVSQSGMIGEGETVVAPELWWTRYVVTYASEDTAIVPSANLVIRGAAVDLTVPQEITQMMRAGQR